MIALGVTVVFIQVKIEQIRLCWKLKQIKYQIKKKHHHTPKYANHSPNKIILKELILKKNTSYGLIPTQF